MSNQHANDYIVVADGDPAFCPFPAKTVSTLYVLLRPVSYILTFPFHFQ